MPNLPKKFPVIVTAASQAEIDHPRFDACMAHMKENANRFRLVVPRGARLKDDALAGYVFRTTGDQVLLHEVLTEAGKLINSSMYPEVIVCDPLVLTGPKTSLILTRDYVAPNQPRGAKPLNDRFGMGNAWSATALALRMKDDEPEGLDEECLRWFAMAENTARSVLRRVPKNVPFVQPVWSGWLAHCLDAILMKSRYHDVTSLHTVASWMPAVSADVSTVGYGPLTFNPPATNYKVALAEIVG